MNEKKCSMSTPSPSSTAPSPAQNETKADVSGDSLHGMVSAADLDSIQKELEQVQYEVGQKVREDEIKRVLASFKLNPLDILDIPVDATLSDINKKYRSLSLLCHPDKCGAAIRDDVGIYVWFVCCVLFVLVSEVRSCHFFVFVFFFISLTLC